MVLREALLNADTRAETKQAALAAALLSSTSQAEADLRVAEGPPMTPSPCAAARSASHQPPGREHINAKRRERSSPPEGAAADSSHRGANAGKQKLARTPTRLVATPGDASPGDACSLSRLNAVSVEGHLDFNDFKMLGEERGLTDCKFAAGGRAASQHYKIKKEGFDKPAYGKTPQEAIARALKSFC